MQSVSEATGRAAVHPKTRDRFRAHALRLAMLAALVALYLGGVWVRTASFQARGHRHSDQFWVESAQHFRNVRMVAEGGTIPALDIDLEYPDGLVTRSHTIHGEYAIGLLGRWLPFERIGRYASSHTLFGIYLDQLLEPFWPVQAPTLSSFVRYFVRLSICTLIFWVYPIVRELSGSRWAGLLAASLYAFSFGSVSRSLGDTFYHEHVALPLLGLHLWFFYRALNREAIYNAILCAVFLLASLLTWKVIEFYFLVLILYFFLMTLGPGLDRRSLRALGCIAIVVLLGSVLLDVHLRYNRFYVSKGMLGAYSCLAAAWFVKRRGARWKYSIVPIALALLALKTVFLPDTVKYNHVWLTFFYRFLYWHKPLDPSLLPFDVRHYWVPPYVSPNLFAFLNEVFWPVVLAVPALLSFVVFLLLPSGWKPAQWSAEHRSKAFLLLGFGCFLLFYLLFYKIKTFLLLFSIPWTGYLWVRWRGKYLGRLAWAALFLCVTALLGVLAGEKGLTGALGWGAPALIAVLGAGALRRSIPRRAALAALVVVASGSQAYQTVAWNQSWLARGMVRIGIAPSKEKEAGNVLPGAEIGDLVDWAKAQTLPGEAFLCEFVMSPSILTYAERPINQHCFFESAMRLKYEEFAYALFKDEEGFYDFCQKYKTTYFVYNAHILLRDDPGMSFRYIADRMGWDSNWAAYRFHFRPEALKHFELVRQSGFLRVYRVLPPGQSPDEKANRNEPYSPLFDEALFQKVMAFDGKGAPKAEGFLYPAVNAYTRYYRAEALLAAGGEQNTLAALVEMTRAVEEDCPWASPIHDRLGEVYLKLGRPQPARNAFERSLSWRPDDPVAKRGVEQAEAMMKN